MVEHIDQFEPEERGEILAAADALAARRHAAACQTDLIEFCKHMQPNYKVGKHHRILADLLMQIALGNKDRLCVNIPPDRKSTRLNSSHSQQSRMPSSA